MPPVPSHLPAAAPGSTTSAPEPPPPAGGTAAPGGERGPTAPEEAAPGGAGAVGDGRPGLAGGPAAGYPIGVRAHGGGTGRVLLTFPGGCVQLDYPAGTMGRAELALPALRDAVRLVPRWRLDRYVARITEGRERHL